MKQKLTLILLLALFSFSVNSQSLIHTVDFETATGYTTSIPEFSDGFSDYFLRTDGSDINSNVEVTNIQGTYFFAAQDIDGEGATLPVTLDIDDINISGYSALELRIYLGEDDDGTNQDWDEPDYVHIDYDIDNSGTFSNGIWIENNGIATNSAPYIDTDFDGTGDGTEIISDLVQFSTILSGTGSLLDIQITFSLNSGDEDIVIDHIEIYGTSGSTDEVDWCNLQWPEGGGIIQGGDWGVYAQVYEDGLTNPVGQGAGITSWVGYSTSDTDPSTWTDWVLAAYNTDAGNNDEYTANIGPALPVGTYYYASRFQLNGGPFSYGGYNVGGGGFWDGITNVSGVVVVSPALPVIMNGYALSDTEVDVIYDISITSVDPADYSLTGSQAISFSTAVIDVTNDNIVHLSGASPTMTGDAVYDNLYDAANNSNFGFYAGITPIMFTNSANDPDTIMMGYNATFTGILSANDAYNNVWVADAEGSMNGVMIFDYDFDALVAVGDEFTFVAEKDLYNDLTELTNPILLEIITSGNTPYGPTEILGDAVDTLEVADSPTAEQWEGQLVTINNALITEADISTDYYFYATDDGGTTHFKVGDNVDYHFGNVAMDVGSTYNITGVIGFSYGYYRINPRDASDIEEVILMPTLTITSPVEGSTVTTSDVDIVFTVENFIVGDNSGGTDDGHIHYTVDAGSTVMYYTTDPIALTGLDDGAHTVFMELVDNSHVALDPPVEATVNFTVDTGIGIDEINSNISIHPNPAQNVLNISNMKNITEISIVNLLGQTVQILEVNSENALININNLNKGMYILNFRTENNEVLSHTFIKE